MAHYRSQEHREKVNELGLNSGSILPTIEGDLSALVDEVTMGTEEEDNLIQTIAESEAFQAAATAAVTTTSSTEFATPTITSEQSTMGFEESSETPVLPNQNELPS